MHTTITTWGARVTLALLSLGFAASAQASTIYNFTFTLSGGTNTTGSFTTDGASPLDPGYELLTSLTFDQLIGFPSGTSYGPFTCTEFDPNAAYNPTTQTFINHAGGEAHPEDVGELLFPDIVNGYFLVYNNVGFGKLGDPLSGDIYLVSANERVDFARGTLASITPAATAAVPEPTSIALLASGLVGVVLRRRQRA
jgi:hypothetical protein